MADDPPGYNHTSPPYSANSPDSEDEDDGRDVIIERDKWTKFKVSFSNELVTRYLNVDGQFDVMLFVSKNKNSKEEKSMVCMIVEDIDEDWDFEALVSINKSKPDRLTKSKPTSRFFFTSSRRCELVVHVKFFDIVSKTSRTLIDDLKIHVSKNSPKVTLVGDDGEVKVNLIWLIARSKVFEAMFEPGKNSEEFQTLRVVILDFSKDVLKQFVHFLRTDLLPEDGNYYQDLLTLADKYDVPLLKEKIQLAAMERSNYKNYRAIQLLSKLESEVLVNIFM